MLNPFFACGADFRYGLPEIEAALAGTWEATWTRDSQTQSVKFRVEADVAEKHSCGMIKNAGACSQRTLVKSAHACKDSTTVPLKVIALDDETTMNGTFVVTSTKFDMGELSINIPNRKTSLMARVSSTGVVHGDEGRAHVRTN